jgi:hypothetical protein
MMYGELGKGEIRLEFDGWLTGEFIAQDARRLVSGAVCIDSGAHHRREI